MNKINLKESFCILYKSFNLFGKYKKAYIIGLILSSTKYVIRFVNPIAYKFITDMVLGNINDFDYIKLLRILMLFIILIPTFCYGHYLRSVSCVKAQGDNQKEIFSYLVKTDPINLNHQDSGLYLTKLADDILFIDRLFKRHTFTTFGKFIIFTFISTILLIKVSFKIFLISFGIGIIFLCISLVVIPMIRNLELSTKKSATKIHSYIINFLNNIVTIRVFALESCLLKKFSYEVNNIAKNRGISKSIVGVCEMFIDLIKIIVQPFSIILMAKFMAHELSISDIIFISGIISVYAEGLCNFVSFFQNIQNDLVCAKRILNIFESQKNNGLNEVNNLKSSYVNVSANE